MATRQDNVGGNFYDPLIQKGFKLASYSYDAGGVQTTIEATFPPVIICDPGGAAVDVLLPAEADSDGLFFWVINTGPATEIISLKEDSDTTVIATIDTAESALVYCDGTTWHTLVGGVT